MGAINMKRCISLLILLSFCTVTIAQAQVPRRVQVKRVAPEPLALETLIDKEGTAWQTEADQFMSAHKKNGSGTVSVNKFARSYDGNSVPYQESRIP